MGVEYVYALKGRQRRSRIVTEIVGNEEEVVLFLIMQENTVRTCRLSGLLIQTPSLLLFLPPPSYLFCSAPPSEDVWTMQEQRGAVEQGARG